MPGRRYIRVIEKKADLVTRHWLCDVRSHPTTPTYHELAEEILYPRGHAVLSQLGTWLDQPTSKERIRSFYYQLGRDRYQEGVGLEELQSCLMLLKRHIWLYILKEAYITSLADHVAAIDLNNRVVVFFDRAVHYATRGYLAALAEALDQRGIADLARAIEPSGDEPRP